MNECKKLIVSSNLILLAHSEFIQKVASASVYFNVFNQRVTDLYV